MSGRRLMVFRMIVEEDDDELDWEAFIDVVCWIRKLFVNMMWKCC